MSSLTELLSKQGKTIVKELRQSYQNNNVNATFKMSNETRSMAAANKLVVDSVDYVLTREFGTPPGSGVTKDDILVWMDAKNLFQTLPVFQKNNIAFNIARKINKEGDALYRGEGRYSNVISSVVNDRTIDEIQSQVADLVLEEAVKRLVDFGNRSDKVDTKVK